MKSYFISDVERTPAPSPPPAPPRPSTRKVFFYGGEVEPGVFDKSLISRVKSLVRARADWGIVGDAYLWGEDFTDWL